MRRLVGPITKVALIFAVLAAVAPKIALIYVICGIYDVLRNTERTPELFEKYFLGEGLPFWLPSPVWLLSPLNTLLDLLSLPYLNKGNFALGDLPKEHQDEIVRLIRSTRPRELIDQLQPAASAERRSMFFFKYYGMNIEQIVDLPELHDDYKWIVTIGVSVFNRRQSVSKHFGPLRATFRILHNVNDMVDDSSYIVVGRCKHYWRSDKLFIFDDTLFHQSVNDSDIPRYCLFVDIIRPTIFHFVFRALVHIVGRLTSNGPNKLFFLQWKVF